MSKTLVFPDLTAARKHAAPRGFVCTLRAGKLGRVGVHVAGELDIATAPRLEQTLRRAEQSASLIVLDLRSLTFMDSSGAHVIGGAAARARRAGRRLVLIRGSAQVDRLLALTGDSDGLDIRDLDLAEPAVRAFARLVPRDAA